MANYREVVARLLTEDMSAVPGEMPLVVTDTDMNHVGRALFKAGIDFGLNSGLFEIPPMGWNGTELPESVARTMESADVMVCPTSMSLTHTRAREAATEVDVRVTAMSGTADQVFSAGAITANYEEVEHLMAALTEKLTVADKARTEAGGASAAMLLSGRDGIPSNDIVADSGGSDNLPSDESYVASVEGTATGTLVSDGDLAGVGVLDDPLAVELNVGHITSVKGAAADEFLDATSGDDRVRRVYEPGLRMNPVVSIVGTVLEDEKVCDTCHIAFEDSLGFGGTIDCDSHFDGAILELTVSFDGDVVAADDEVRV